MSVERDDEMIPTGQNRGTRKNTCPRATLSTANPKRTDPGANPSFRGERPATVSQSHGTDPLLDVITDSFGNGYNHSVWNLLFSRLLSKGIGLKMKKKL
jgi:hypothetical protein